MSSSQTITSLLHAVQEGDSEAFDRLYGMVYEELHRLARHVRRGRVGDTLNTTALVHEAYLKLLPSSDLDWKDRSHFFAVAARAMRQVLCRYAERRMAQKRGGGVQAVPLDETFLVPDEQCEDLVALDEALGRLEKISNRQSRIVECRFFGGLTIDETAAVMDISPRTVKRDWTMARLWLTREIKLML